MDLCGDSVQSCVAEILIRDFEVACAKATLSIKDGIRLREACSGPIISAHGFLFGIVVCWQIQDDGSPDLSSDLGVGLRRLDAEARCAVVCLREVRILNRITENSKVVTDTDTEDALPGEDVGWLPHAWGGIDEFPLGEILKPSLGWLQDGHLRVECKLLCRGAFIVGDKVRSHYNMKGASDEPVKSSDTDQGTVKSINAAEVTIAFESCCKQAVPREWIVAFASGSDVPPARTKTEDPVRADLACLLDSEAFADATIEVVRADGTADELLVHAAILWARSEVFKRMLNSQMREGKEKRIVITHLEAPAVRAIVVFMYSGEVPASMLADTDSALSLLVAAHFFDERALVAKCAAAVGSKLDAASVCEGLLTARLYDCRELMLYCLMLLRRHILDVHGTAAFGKVLETCLRLPPQSDPQSSLLEGCLPARGSCAGSTGLCPQAAQRHRAKIGNLRLGEAPMKLPSRFGFDIRMCVELDVVSANPSSQEARTDSECSVEFLGRCRPQLTMVPLPGQHEFGATVFHLGSHKDLHDGGVLRYGQMGRVSGPGTSTDIVEVQFEGLANLFEIPNQEISSEDPGTPGGLQVNDAVFLIGDPRCGEDLELGDAGLVLGVHSSTHVAVLFDGCEEAVDIHHEMLSRDPSVLLGGWRINDEAFFTGRTTKYGRGLPCRIVGSAEGHRSFTHLQVQFDLDQEAVLVNLGGLSRERPRLPGGWCTQDIAFKRGGRGQLGKVCSAVTVAEHTDWICDLPGLVCDPVLHDDATSLFVLFAGDSAPVRVPIKQLTQTCTLSELLRCVSQNYSNLKQCPEFAPFVDRFLKDAPLWAQLSRQLSAKPLKTPLSRHHSAKPLKTPLSRQHSAKPLRAQVSPCAQRGAYQRRARRW